MNAFAVVQNPYIVSHAPAPVVRQFPCSGDLFLSTGSGFIPDQCLHALFSVIGTPTHVIRVERGIALRMLDTGTHYHIAQQLVGAVLQDSQILLVALIT
jgi:hypothetical protein